MASVENGRFTARIDGSCVAFTIGMWLPLHKDPAAVVRGVTKARSNGAPHSTPNV